MPKIALRVAAFLIAGSSVALSQRTDWFSAPVLHEGLVPEFELVADLDGDGDLDVVAFTYGGAGVFTTFTVMANEGFGTLTRGAMTALPASQGSARATLVDLNGDGDPDLLVSTDPLSPHGWGLLVFSGQPGLTFAPPLHVPTPGWVDRLARGNGNGDSIDDVFLTHRDANQNTHVRWIFGHPTATPVLGPAMTLPFGTPIGDYAITDLDGDGIDDVGFGTANSIAFFATTATGFAGAGGVTLGTGAGNLGQVLATDRDGDGDRDLVVAARSANNTNLIPVDNLGGGTWLVGTPQSFPSLPTGWLHSGDWDGDGRDDLVLRGIGLQPQSHSTVHLRSNASGAYSQHQSVTIPGHTSGSGAGLYDLNGDGLADFVDSKSVHFSDGTFGSPTTGTAVWRVLDWDRDGDLDVDGIAGIQHNDGRAIMAQPLPIELPAAPSGFGYAFTVAVSDLDDDGRHEYFVSYLDVTIPHAPVFVEMRQLVETAPGQLTDLGPAALPGARMADGVFDDIDGDGDLDLIEADTIWLNDGSSFFTAQTGGFAGYAAIGKGDVDGDGDIDFLAANTAGGMSLAILERVAPGVLALHVLYPGGSLAGTASGLLVDLDGDGDLDVIGHELPSNNQQVAVFTNSGGLFTRAATILQTGRISVGDIDGDNLVDLVFCEGNRARILLRSGPGLTYHAPFTCIVQDVLGAFDMDQDGDPDLMGREVAKNGRLVAPGAGERRQYGDGTPGTGGNRPILSATGAIRTGLSPEVRLRNAVGGAFALLLVGAGEANLPVPALPGFTLYASPVFVTLGQVISGPFGAQGRGGFDLPVAIPPGFGGTRLWFQCLVIDAAGQSGVTQTNGVEFTIGQ